MNDLWFIVLFAGRHYKVTVKYSWNISLMILWKIKYIIIGGIQTYYIIKLSFHSDNINIKLTNVKSFNLTFCNLLLVCDYVERCAQCKLGLINIGTWCLSSINNF